MRRSPIPICRHSWRPSRPPCARGAGARIGGFDGDADKRSLERGMVGIRPRRRPLDDPGGADEGAERTSRGVVQARARDRQRTLGGAKLRIRFPRSKARQAAFEHGDVDAAGPHGQARRDNLARLPLDVLGLGVRSQPFSSELRETALAHTIGNKAEAAYRRGDALEKRRTMMEAWAAWCEPKEPNVVAFAKSGGAV